MPSLDAIRNLTIRGSAPGVNEAAASLDRLSAAQGRVTTSAGSMATVTDISSKRQLSAAAALSRLAASHDETYRAQQQHAKSAALLERATAQGLAGTREFAIAQAAVNKLHHEAAGAVGFNRTQIAESVHVVKALGDEFAASGLSIRGFLMESGRIGQILTEGQGGVGGTLKATGALLGRLATGWVGLGVATTAAVALSAAAAISYENSQARLQRAVEGTGRAAGVSAAQLGTLAAAGARSGNLGGGEAQGLAAGYTQAGLGPGITSDLLGSTSRFARFNGQDNAEAGKTLADAFRDPVAGAQTLDKSLSFLNDRLSTTIHDYEASGQHAMAQRALLDAYDAALKQTTDSTWAVGEAMKDLKRWAGAVAGAAGYGVDRFFGGGHKPEDDLKSYQAMLPHTFDSPFAIGNTSRTYVQSQIDRLQHEIDARVDPAAAARDADANRLSSLVGPLVRGILPEITRATDATSNLTALRQAMTDPGIVAKLGGGIGQDQVQTAFQRTAVTSANADPLRRMQQDYDLARASADAFSLAEHAAVDARRAELAVLRETGDVSRAAVAAEMARNAAIEKANSDAEDRLGAAKDQAGLVGLLPGQRALEELRLKFEGYGGQYAKDAASKSELDDAMKPVANDLRSAGEDIARAMRDAAARIVAVPNDSVGPFSPAPFTGRAGPVSDHQRQLVSMLQQAGFSNRAADVGFVGGLTGESGAGLDPHATNPTSGAYGIEQALGARKDALLALPNHDDFLVQARQLIHELQTSESAAGARLRNATDIQGGLAANLNFERPSQSEIASSYNRRLAAGTSLGADLLGLAPRGAEPLTISRTVANNNVPGGPSPVAGVAPVASTALGTDHSVYNTERDALVRSQQTGPTQEATLALQAQRAALEAQISTFGQSASVVAAAGERQRLYAEYARQGVAPTDDTRAAIDRMATSYGDLAKAQQDAQQHQRDLISTMDDFRDVSKGALSSFVGDMMAGKSATQGLHDALTGIAGKLAGKLEDTAIDSLFGASGTPGGGLFGGGLSGLLGGGVAGGGMFASLGSGSNYATGGWVSGPGSGTSDSVPARLSNGEFVVRATAAARHADILHAINTSGLPGFAAGGFVGGGPAASGGSADGGGDLHVHVYGGSGDDHIRALVSQGVQHGISRNNVRLPGMLDDQKRRA